MTVCPVCPLKKYMGRILWINNGHTGQTVKQHINSKHSTHVFLEWTHGTNGQTTYSFKAFYPCLFLMVTQVKRSNNIIIQSILPRCFFNGHTGQTVKQHFYPGVFIMDTHDKQTNNIYIQSILPISFFNGHTGQTVN